MITTISTRVATVTQVASRVFAARTFSTNCEPALRLRQALADYKRAHFSRETPHRFRKEVLSPYTVNDSVDVEALNKLLTNIGHAQDCLSATEQSLLLQEAGCSGRSIPVPKLAELLD